MALLLRACGTTLCNASLSRCQSITVHLAASSSLRHTSSLPSLSGSWASPAQSTTLLQKPQRLSHRATRRMAAAVMSPAKPESVYDFTVKDIDGKDIDLTQFKGKVILVVNVASQCGFTPQYKELAQLYERHKDSGLVILGFPCNQFGQQEPGDNDRIKKFAQERGAKFPMMSKIDVNGANADPVYKFMKEQQGGVLFSDIKWNFTKFLIDRQGKVIKRYGSVQTPLSIENDVKSLL